VFPSRVPRVPVFVPYSHRCHSCGVAVLIASTAPTGSGGKS